jgi:hypothetical protein
MLQWVDPSFKYMLLKNLLKSTQLKHGNIWRPEGRKEGREDSAIILRAFVMRVV